VQGRVQQRRGGVRETAMLYNSQFLANNRVVAKVSCCGNGRLVQLFLGHSYRLRIECVALGLALPELAALSLRRKQANEISIFCCVIDRLVIACSRRGWPPSANCCAHKNAGARNWCWGALQRVFPSCTEQQGANGIWFDASGWRNLSGWKPLVRRNRQPRASGTRRGCCPRDRAWSNVPEYGTAVAERYRQDRFPVDA